MSTCILLAPGPSMSQALADSVRGSAMVGVVTSAYTLAPWADFMVANDIAFWLKSPGAKAFAGKKFTANRITGVETVRGTLITSSTNSGTLALEVAKREGATRIALLGFDMHGSHFFGKYSNGLTNTPAHRRAVHLQQYRVWRHLNKTVEVINCTPGSKLDAFPTGSLEEVLSCSVP